MKIRLKEIGDIITGNTPSKKEMSFWNSKDIPFVKPDTISENGISIIEQSNEYISEEARSKARVVSKNAIFVTCIGTIGKIGIASDGVFAFNQQINAIIPNNNVDSRYLAYALLHNRTKLEDIANAPVVPIINKSQFGDFSIDIQLDRAIQRSVVNKLDAVANIIKIRNEELTIFDNLIKARFVELFGDPVLNPLGWEEKTVIEECDCMVPGRDKPKSFTGDIPWITIDDLNVDGVTYISKNGLGLTQEEIDAVNRKTIPAGSVIMSCVGNLGICSIAGRDMIINQQLHSFQCGERVDNVFLMHYLGYRKGYMNKWASNTTVLYMNKSICNSIPLIIPPIELQREFSEFADQVDKSKVVVQKSIDETQLLLDSLMQEYFR